MEYKECYQKIYASWLGKLIGIRLGAPIENWLGKDVRKMYHPIRNYTVDYGQFAADDDANGPLFFVSVMEKYNLDTITVKAMGEHLLNVVGNHTGFFWWGGKGVASEETAWQNLMDGIEAPESGSIKTNGKALAEQIGGQIFSDCWGYITLGKIEDAVRLSSMMASVTHDGEAIEGAKFVAACIAAAWNKKDIRDVIDTAKTYLNKESSYYALIEEIEDYYDSNPEDSDKCLAYIEDKYDYKNFEGVCHILPNTAIMLYGMLYGKNSFDETMRLIAEAGRDTDCNLGNVGSIMGMMLGLEGISEKWITPFNDILLSSSSIGSRNITTISESTKYFTDLASKLYNIPTDTDTNGYDFSLPYATHGFYVSSNRYACASLRTHDNKLQINLATLKKGKKVYLELKTYYQSKDVYDCRYQPQYTPLYEKGDSIRLKFNNVENLPVVIHFSEMADNEKENDINLELDKEVTLSCNSQKNSHMITSLVFEITALEDIAQSILELETFEIVKHPEIDYQFANFENEDWGYSFGGDHETGVKGITIYKGKAEVNNNALVLHAKSAINMSSIFAKFKKLTYTLNKSDELNVILGYDYQGCFSYKGIQLDSIQKKIYYIERETYTNIKKVEVGDLKELSGLVKVTLDINKQVMILNDESYDVSNMHAEGGALVIINDSDKDISLLSVTAGEWKWERKKKKVIIDCDPGHDDVMAILSILASDDVEVLGITTVCGNNYCNVVTENLLNVLSYINRTDICVAKGQDRPLIYNPEPQDAHGYNGLEGFDFPQPIMQIVSNNAVEFMKNLIDEEDNKVTILALAPLTNIALLLRTYPEVKKNIDEIILMGGSIYRGNILARSEFNIYADPHAAEMVMESGVKTVILPLEGCDYCLVTEEDIAYWENEDGRASRIVAALMNYFAEYGRKRGRKEFTVFDLGVSMYLLHPEMFEGYNCSCKVVLEGADTRGMTIIEPKEKSHIKVLTKCDTELFRKYIREDIDKIDKQFALNYPNE